MKFFPTTTAPPSLKQSSHHSIEATKILSTAMDTDSSSGTASSFESIVQMGRPNHNHSKDSSVIQQQDGSSPRGTRRAHNMQALLATLQLDDEAADGDHAPLKHTSGSGSKKMAANNPELLRKQPHQRSSRLTIDVFDDDDTSTCDEDSQHSAVLHLSREFLHMPWPSSKREQPRHHSRPPLSCIAIDQHTERFEI